MRLIDAERVRAEIFKASMDEHFMPMKLLDCDTVTEIIDNAPTIEERKVGKWIDSYPDIEPNPMFGFSICSICGFRQNLDSKLKFCPNCGARMEGD